jgi:hypothetical protein
MFEMLMIVYVALNACAMALGRKIDKFPMMPVISVAFVMMILIG